MVQVLPPISKSKIFNEIILSLEFILKFLYRRTIIKAELEHPKSLVREYFCDFVKLKRLSLVLLRCKPKFENLRLGLIAVQIGIRNFRAWPYCGANSSLKFLSLALLRCKSKFEIFELGLIAVQIKI